MFHFCRVMAGSAVLSIVALVNVGAQPISMADLSFFRNPGKNWQIVGEVKADLARSDAFIVTPGKGVLVNLPEKNNHSHLQTVLEHGDLELELDYMMGRESNSGIYLQGRYEIQLFDSWLTKKVSENDNGSIYGRQAARQNASRAAGLWQHMKVVFRAPRFDHAGKKTQNARIVSLHLNGVLIHDNVELPWQTAGAIEANEVPKGALLIQGDHGVVAFRNIRFAPLETVSLFRDSFQYSVYAGQFTKIPDLKSLKPSAVGNSTKLLSGVAHQSNSFLLKYTGSLVINTPGEYTFFLVADAGYSQVKVDGKEVYNWDNPDWRPARKVVLPAGKLPLEIVYAKTKSESGPSLGLTVSSPSVLPVFSGDPWAEAARYDDEGPMYLDATEPTILRSFTDLPAGYDKKTIHRVTHGVNVGHPEGIHYTYDLDQGAVVQAWRGQFLETTPMWRGRGDGSSTPRGVVTRLDSPVLLLNRLASSTNGWSADTTGSGYQPDGYSLDAQDLPTFRYTIFGSRVSDRIRAIASGEGLHRVVTVLNPSPNLYARLASASQIEPLGNGVYLIGDHQYYIWLDNPDALKPAVRNAEGGQELVVPMASGQVSYSIWF